MLASSPVNSSPIINPQNTSNGSLASNPNTPLLSNAVNIINPITSGKFLSKQDREALLQYTKHFTRKAVQIIVQSRLGDIKPTKSRVYAFNSDWFNLSIKDILQITTMTKLSLGNVESLFNVGSPFCVEISLRTPENQTMILETWCILFNDQLVDPTQKVCFSVYKKMSLVLRSLMCITRCTPTYQLSRRQSPESYVLLYRMYCGEPIVHHLGENYATAKVGTIGTPIGSLIVNVAYRTRLTMTTTTQQQQQQQTSYHSNDSYYASGGYGGGIRMKDNHFDSRISINTTNNNNNENNSDPNSPNTAILINDQQQQISPNSLLNRYSTSKTQPIPMRQGQGQGQQQTALAIIPSRQHQFNNDESSADENNGSSVASTPDTMYYFKLKSAAFTSNHHSSMNAVNSNNESAETTPFSTLLNNDMSNLNLRGAQQHQQLAQSPPPPSLEYMAAAAATTTTPTQQQPAMQLQRFISRNNSLLNNDQHHDDSINMVSPCSLPNFKTLDNQFQFQHNQQQRHLSNNANNEVRTFYGPSSFTNQQQPDDFVFIESKKIAFGLSNAANDLSTFFRACENAPILDSFQNEPCLTETLKDLDQQLLMYESKVSEFDELIKSLENNV